ncbi:MAG TPA: hypothetical protein VGK25_08390 [Ignavibacteria bacterium]
MARGFNICFKALLVLFVALLFYVLLNSSFDLYNNFAYDKAIIRENPYGYTPLLKDVYNYQSGESKVKSGDYVYVEDWLSAYNGRVIFAKVRSKFDWGYVNKDLLVQTNINILPVFSSLTLTVFFILLFRLLIRKIYT